MLLSAVHPDRRGVVLLHPRAAIRNGWKDSFGRYPIDWTARLTVPSEWIWAGPGQRDGFDDREEVKTSGWDLR